MSNPESPISSSQSLVPSPQSLVGNRYEDERGIITFNNDFDASQIKRIYTIENHSTEFIRGWQGHKIEQRWFAVMKGKFKIGRILFDDINELKPETKIEWFEIEEGNLDYLYFPPKHLSCIQALEPNSKLLALADYGLGEVQDEVRYPLEFFDRK